MWELFPGFVMWTLWKERNAHIFRNCQISSATLWDSMVRNLKDTLRISSWSAQDLQAPATETQILENWGIKLRSDQTTHLRTKTIHPSSPDRWHPPSAGSYKLNFDGHAAKGNPGQAGFGGAIQNHLGEIMWAYWGSVGWDTNNVDELEGILAGMALVANLNIQPVILEGDSQIIINLAKKLQQGYQVNKITKNWRLEFCVERLADIIGRFRHCAFSHVRRRANRVADKLANQGVTVDENFTSTKWPPQNAADWVRQVSQITNEDQQIHKGTVLPTNPPGINDGAIGGSLNPPRAHRY